MIRYWQSATGSSLVVDDVADRVAGLLSGVAVCAPSPSGFSTKRRTLSRKTSGVEALLVDIRVISGTLYVTVSLIFSAR